MGLFLEKLEKGLRLSTGAHVVGIPLDDAFGSGHYDERHQLQLLQLQHNGNLAAHRGPVLSAEQQVLIDVLRQLFKIREREEAQRWQRKRSEAWWTGDAPITTSSSSSPSAEFLNEFVKVVAVCQALLSQREEPLAKRKRKLDSAWYEEQPRSVVGGEEEKEREEDLRIEAVMIHLHKRAKLVDEVCQGVCCDEHAAARQEEERRTESMSSTGHTANSFVEVGQGCIVSLVRQVAATMVSASHSRNKRRWASADCQASTPPGEDTTKRRRTRDLSLVSAERKRKFGGEEEDSGALTLKRGSGVGDCNALCKSDSGLGVKRKRLGITITITSADAVCNNNNN